MLSSSGQVRPVPGLSSSMRFSISAVCRRSSSNGVFVAREASSFEMLAAIASRRAHSATSDPKVGGTADGLDTWPEAASVPQKPATTQEIRTIFHAAVAYLDGCAAIRYSFLLA